MKPHLSLAMIVKNEEASLANCLRSVQGLVDEIVIVDTGSTDRTLLIAEQFGAKIFHHPWENDFSKARNHAIGHASSDWILVLDADEVVAQEDHSRIRSLLHEEGASMYFLTQTTFLDESATMDWIPNKLEAQEAKGYPGYSESPLVRLFRKNPLIQFEGIIHEHAMTKASNIEITKTDVRIYHYGKYISKEASLKKDALYLRLGEEKLKRNPQSAAAHFELGVQYWQMKQSERGRAVLLQAEALDPRSVRTQVALAGIAAEAKNHTEAIRRYARIMEIDPAHELPYLFLPALLIEIKNFRLAEEILAVGEKWVGHQPSYHINRGVVYQALGKHHLALGCFDKAFALNPKDRNAVLNQGVSFLELGFVEEAEKKFEQCINDEALRIMAYKGLADIAFRKKDLAQAGHYLEQALLADPEDDESKLRLGIVKIQEGDFSKSAHWIHQITQDQQLSEKDRERLYFCRKALGNRSPNTQTDKGEHHDHLNH